MSADAMGLVFLCVLIATAAYVTARANRLKLQRETLARLAEMQEQLDAISEAVVAGAKARPVERVLVAERIAEQR